MKRLLSTLEGIDTRLLALGAILFCAVIFALVKASGAINGSVAEPAYRNTPAQAFVPPSSVTLVAPQYLQEARLPDQDYIALVSTSRALANGVANLTVTVKQLQQAGLGGADAAATVLTLRADDATLSGRQASVEANLPVTPGSNYNSAVVTANVQYSATPSGSPPVTATESFNYGLVSGHYWRLQSVTLELQAGALGG